MKTALLIAVPALLFLLIVGGIIGLVAVAIALDQPATVTPARPAAPVPQPTPVPEPCPGPGPCPAPRPPR